MNHVDGVIKRDVYPQKMPSFSKKYPWFISLFFRSKNIRGISKNIYIMGDIACIFEWLKDNYRYTIKSTANSVSLVNKVKVPKAAI